MNCYTRTALLLAAATLLIGIGSIAILPPFEGYDEPAHYSSMRQIADTGTLPIGGRSFIDQNVSDYEKNGPNPWGSGEPPFDNTGRMNYASFFANAEAVAGYEIYRRLPADKAFAPGPRKNYESQHAPLYYLLLAPIMKLTEPLPLVTQFLVLRLLSYALALAGLMIGWAAVRADAGRVLPSQATASYLLYPFVVPAFFPEFARLGNDSLCLFLLGIVFSFTVRIVRGDGGLPLAFAMGVALGLGLLTKAFFIPIIAGYAFFMALRAWQARHDAAVLRRRLAELAVMLAMALVLGGGWYLYQFLAFGSPTGSVESIELDQMGGLAANLRHKFSFYILVRDIAAIFATLLWAGTHSLARISPLLQFLLSLPAAWFAISYAREARRHAYSDLIWLPVWLFAPFFFGLLYHILVVIALGRSGTPGWYLNILAPFFGVALAYGVDRIGTSRIGHAALGICLLYLAFFLPAVLWSQMALFAGCAIKTDERYYHFTGQWFCLDRMTEVTGHLSVFGWPYFALASMAVGYLSLVLGLLSFLAYRRDIGDYPEQSHLAPAPGPV